MTSIYLPPDCPSAWPATALEYELPETRASIRTGVNLMPTDEMPSRPSNRADSLAIERGEGEGMTLQAEQPAAVRALSKGSDAHAVPDQ